MTFSKVIVRLRFFLHIAKISLILYEFYFEDIAKISQIVGPLGHTISTAGNGTQRKTVIFTADIFTVYLNDIILQLH